MVRDEHQRIETEWHRVFGKSFTSKYARIREGSKAEYEYTKQRSPHWFIVPFFSKVEGTPIQPTKLNLSAFECEGPLVELVENKGDEFFIVPDDWSWTFVSTHEDHIWGGPYFIERDSWAAF